MFVDHEGVYHERFCDSVSDRSLGVTDSDAEATKRVQR